ncbi:unnamed protein product, partial [Aureobasidium uvarum]
RQRLRERRTSPATGEALFAARRASKIYSGGGDIDEEEAGADLSASMRRLGLLRNDDSI